MMILSRDILNKDLVYDGVNYTSLCDMIDYWKIVLWEKYSVRPGHNVSAIVSLTDVYYVSLVIACLELGVSLAVTDKPIHNNFHGVRQRLYGPMQLALVDDLNWEDSQLTCAHQYFKHVDNIKIFDDYTIQDPSLWDKIAKKIFAKSDSIAILTTTSGTSKSPTVVKHTHEWILDSSIRAVKILNFHKDEVVLHTRQLSHGSILDLFLLPSLMTVDQHHMFNYNSSNVNQFVDYIMTYKINKFMIFSSVAEILNALPVLEHTLNIITSAKPSENIVTLVKSKNISSFIVSYGSSESGNNILVNSITPTTNPLTHEPNNYGPLRDDHYSLELFDDHVVVEVKKFKKKVKLNDKLEFRNGNYYFYNRTDQYRINDVFISELNISTVSKSITKLNHDVIIDPEFDSIYLAFYEDFDPQIVDHVNRSLAENIHRNTFISKAVRVDYESIAPAYKPLKDVIRNFARSQNI